MLLKCMRKCLQVKVLNLFGYIDKINEKCIRAQNQSSQLDGFHLAN